MISIEGNIGCGKSEILSCLKMKGFKNVHNSLKNIEDDKTSFTYFCKLVTSYANLKENDIIESSARSHLQVFAKSLNDDNKKITDLQLSILCALHLELPIPEIKKIIYIDVSPEICLKRIQLRLREDEKHITLDYLKMIEKYYDDYLNEMKLKNIEVIRIKLTDNFLSAFSPIEISDQVCSYI